MEAFKEIATWLATSKKENPVNHLTVLCNGSSIAAKEAAQQLAKNSKKQLHIVNLSEVVSKYIGETEKNLAALFEKAKAVNAILFFDEGDALFGKRTIIRDAHDKYANQEVSYLVKKIENHNGLIIFAVTNKKNIDEAFIRRMRIIIDFPKPQKN